MPESSVDHNESNRWQTLSSAANVVSILLGIPFCGWLILGSVAVGFAILGGLILLQLPFFMPLLLRERTRRRRLTAVSQTVSDKRPFDQFFADHA